MLMTETALLAIQNATLALAKRLIACRSVTPADGGSLDLAAARLEAAGFVCERIDRGGVGNLWARHGDAGPPVCFAGRSRRSTLFTRACTSRR